MNTQQQTIGYGSNVRMHFSITLEDGTVADSSRADGSLRAEGSLHADGSSHEESEPLEFSIGDGSLIEGLEMALMGLKAGDTQTLRIGPELGFGFHDEDNVHAMARSEFASDMQLAPGVIIGFDTPSGVEVPGTIVEVGDDQVKVDFNHPLAGHEITFEVEILSVQPATAANDEQVE